MHLWNIQIFHPKNDDTKNSENSILRFYIYTSLEEFSTIDFSSKCKWVMTFQQTFSSVDFLSVVNCRMLVEWGKSFQNVTFIGYYFLHTSCIICHRSSDGSKRFCCNFQYAQCPLKWNSRESYYLEDEQGFDMWHQAVLIRKMKSNQSQTNYDRVEFVRICDTFVYLAPCTVGTCRIILNELAKRICMESNLKWSVTNWEGQRGFLLVFISK